MQIYASTKLSYARRVETHFWFHKRVRWLALQFFFLGAPGNTDVRAATINCRREEQGSLQALFRSPVSRRLE